MANATDIARYLIHLSYDSDEPDPLTHLRLQKLLYYAQGNALAFIDRPLFDDRLEAWVNGPVVREVYGVFAPYMNQCIPRDEGREDGGLSEDDKAFVRSVWAYYNQFSASALVQRTHSESPWVEARHGLAAHAPSSREIPHVLLKRFFEGVAERELRPGFDLQKLRRIEEQMAHGRGVKFQDLLARLGLTHVLDPVPHS